MNAVQKFFVTHGLPLSLRTHNGPQFTSGHFTKYLEENGIKLRLEPHPYGHKPMVK